MKNMCVMFTSFENFLFGGGKIIAPLHKILFMIPRDGCNISLWQDSINEYISVNQPDFSKLYDVVIVGGGITGISTGLSLQNAGLNCLVLESHNLCFGTTGGTTAHINTLLEVPYTTVEKIFSKEKAKLN